jgi:hypothetical protein
MIYKADESSYAAAMGEDMKTHFPGADYELIDGNPCRQCQDVIGGRDMKIRKQIKEWINGRG